MAPKHMQVLIQFLTSFIKAEKLDKPTY